MKVNTSAINNALQCCNNLIQEIKQLNGMKKEMTVQRKTKESGKELEKFYQERVHKQLFK